MQTSIYIYELGLQTKRKQQLLGFTVFLYDVPLHEQNLFFATHILFKLENQNRKRNRNIKNIMKSFTVLSFLSQFLLFESLKSFLFGLVGKIDTAYE